MRRWLTVALLLLVAAHARAAVEATIDRTVIRANESVTLTLTARGSGAEPDLAPLAPDWEVLNQSSQTSIRIVNGQYTRESRFELTLMPRREGRLEIPPLEIGGETSRPIVVEVEPPAAGDARGDVFLDVSLSTDRPYVHAEVVYTVRLFLAIGVRSTRWSDLRVVEGDAIVEQLGDDRQYQTERDGRPYIVWERRYSVFPQASGALRLAPVTLEASVLDSRRSPRLARFESDAVELEVRPIPPRPADLPPGPWLPARSLILAERLTGDADALVAGEPVTRTVITEAEGLLPSQLPGVTMGAPDSVRLYPDQPVTERSTAESGFVARRLDRAAVIPTEPGEFVLPPVELAWFDVEDEAWRVARVDARRLSVAPAAAPPGPAPVEVATVAVEAAPLWQTVAAMLGLGWLATLAAWWLRSRRDGGAAPLPIAPAAHRPELRDARDRALAACRDGRAADARRAVLAWGRLRWPDDPPLGLAAVGARLDERTRAALVELEVALFGPSGAGRWDGAELAAALSAASSRRPPREAAPAPALAPLNPPA